MQADTEMGGDKGRERKPKMRDTPSKLAFHVKWPRDTLIENMVGMSHTEIRTRSLFGEGAGEVLPESLH